MVVVDDYFFFNALFLNFEVQKVVVPLTLLLKKDFRFLTLLLFSHILLFSLPFTFFLIHLVFFSPFYCSSSYSCLVLLDLSVCR